MDITIKGNLGTDPELKFTKNNKAYVSFSLAYTPRVKQGEVWIDGETIWFRAVQWGEKSEILMDNLSKGDTVLIQGSWKPSTYTGKDGIEKTGLELNVAEIGKIIKAGARAPKQRTEAAPW
jgi:single-strand DNA-binding protein